MNSWLLEKTSFWLNKAYQFYVESLNCFKIYKIMADINIRRFKVLMEVIRKTRYSLNLFIERINSFKINIKPRGTSSSKIIESTKYISLLVKRKGIQSHWRYRGSDDPTFFSLGNHRNSVN